MGDDDVTAAIQEMAADDSAGATSELGETTSECPDPIVNIGIFFDGTWNNGLDSDRPRTNVHRLASLYKTARDDIRSPSGTCVQEAFRSIYITGIGSESGMVGSRYSGSTGIGYDGIVIRLEDATNQFGAIIDSFGGFSSIQEVRVDLFGFSRGAATARVYANALAAAGVAKLRIRFLGCYDTVGSFGIPGDDREGYFRPARGIWQKLLSFVSPAASMAFRYDTLDLNIHGNTAEYVYQITADDEFRAFFPLSRIIPLPTAGVEVASPGCHGDIGGSGPENGTVTENHHRSLRNSHPFLFERGFFGTAEQGTWTDRRDNIRAGNYTRTVKAGLIWCTLWAMYLQAVGQQVPFKTYTFQAPPEELWDLASALAGGRSLPEPERRRLAADYTRASWGGIGNNIDFDHERERYPNRP